MLRFSQIAAPAVLGLGLTFGAVGCADRYHEVPTDAVVLREGKHALSATANHAGTIYVLDDSRHKMIYSGPVNKGDDVSIDPTADRITVNGKTVTQQELDNDHKFKILMDEKMVNGRPVTANDMSMEEGKTTVITKQGDSTVVRQPGSDTTVITKPDQTIIKNNNDR